MRRDPWYLRASQSPKHPWSVAIAGVMALLLLVLCGLCMGWVQ